MTPLNEHAKQCAAKSKRSGKRCKNPAVGSFSVCRMHGARGGAPIGNVNAFVHGHWSAASKEYRRLQAAQRRNVNAMFKFFNLLFRPYARLSDIPGYTENLKEEKRLIKAIEPVKKQVQEIRERGKCRRLRTRPAKSENNLMQGTDTYHKQEGSWLDL